MHNNGRLHVNGTILQDEKLHANGTTQPSILYRLRAAVRVGPPWAILDVRGQFITRNVEVCIVCAQSSVLHLAPFTCGQSFWAVCGPFWTVVGILHGSGRLRVNGTMLQDGKLHANRTTQPSILYRLRAAVRLGPSWVILGVRGQSVTCNVEVCAFYVQSSVLHLPPVTCGFSFWAVVG